MGSELQITLRRATANEAQKVTELMQQAFKEAYADRMNLDDLNAYMAAHFNGDIQQKELENHLSATFLAETDKQPIGYVQWVQTTHPECVTGDRPVHMQRFYVLKQYWGAGIADQLMKTCLTQLSATSYTDIWLSCWKKNARALSFYRRWGFSSAGEAPFLIGSDLQSDYIMVRPV